MFFIIFILMFACSAYCSVPLDLFIKFSDTTGNAEKVSIPNLVAEQFKTIKNMVDTLDQPTQDNPIPFEAIRKKIFYKIVLFMYLVVSEKYEKQASPQEEKTDPFKDVSPINIRFKLGNIDDSFTVQDKKELLLISNYLDPDKKFTCAVASLYADALKTNVIDVKDPLPSELQPFVAGWLLHDLLHDAAIKPEFTNIVLPNDLLFQSCSFSNTGVSWLSEMDKESINFFYHDLVLQKILPPINLKNDNRNGSTCLSSDGKYGLVFFNDTKGNISIQLFNLKTNQSIWSYGDQLSANKVGVVYDDAHKRFVVILEQWANQLIYLYTVNANDDVKGWQALDSISTAGILSDKFENISIIAGSWRIPHGILGSWKYIGDYLIHIKEGLGAYVILYNLETKQLEFNGSIDEYERKKDKKFGVMTYYLLDQDFPNKLPQLIVQSFIPDYADIMSNRAISDAVKQNLAGARDTHFDPLYMRYVSEHKRVRGHDLLKIYSLVPYQLGAALKIIHDKYRTDMDDNFLKNVWRVYHSAKQSELLKNLVQKPLSVNNIEENTYPEIKALYPLPKREQIQEKRTTRGILGSLKRNIGSFLTRSKNAATYFYYLNSNLFKTFAIFGGASLLAWILYKKYPFAYVKTAQTPGDRIAGGKPIVRARIGESVVDEYRGHRVRTIFHTPGTFRLPSQVVIVSP